MPVSLKAIYPIFKNKRFRLLDVGCGNHSPQKTKYWFPHVEYYGLDREVYNNDQGDLSVMKEFYNIDLSDPGLLKQIPDDFFDAIIISHIIEHIHSGLAVVETMAQKLKKGGYIYIEYPSSRSVNLPSMKGTLNFFDDRTHVKLYSLTEIIHTLQKEGCVPLRYGTRRDLARLLLTLPNCLYSKLKLGYVSGGVFWDILGFAEFVFANKIDNLKE